MSRTFMPLSLLLPGRDGRPVLAECQSHLYALGVERRGMQGPVGCLAVCVLMHML